MELASSSLSVYLIARTQFGVSDRSSLGCFLHMRLKYCLADAFTL